MDDNSAVKIADPGRRAAAYWFADGLPELAYGTALAISEGATLLLGLYLRTLPMLLVTIAGYLALIVLFAWEHSVVGLIKARITYPRTGYVQPPGTDFDPSSSVQTLGLTPESSARRNFSWFRGRIVLLLMVVPQALQVFDQPWALPALMVLLALLFYFTSRESEVPVSLISAVLLALLGFVPMLIGFPLRGRVFVAGLLGGLWLMARGLWKLALYLHNHPTPRVNAGAGA